MVENLRVHPLFCGCTVSICDVRCRPHGSEPRRDEWVSAHEVVFPRMGVFVRHVGCQSIVADSGQVLFFNCHQPYRISHPVLNHQFLRIHERDLTKREPGRVPYETIAFIGYDNTSERYVMHLLDVYGGRWSGALGYGKQAGDRITLVFEYSDGPFHTIFRWVPQEPGWRILMRHKDRTGAWKTFGEKVLHRSQGP